VRVRVYTWEWFDQDCDGFVVSKFVISAVEISAAPKLYDCDQIGAV